jgi:hypothetical protein
MKMIRTRTFWAGSAIAAILSANSLAHAADYYFDTVGGDDGKDGTTEANAKKTFKMPTSGTGNKVHIKRGSTISGNLGVNNVTVVAYGCGTRPIVNGAITVNGGTVEGIKAMPVTSAGIQVQANGVVRDCESDGSNFAPTTSAQAAGGMGITVNGTNNKIFNNYVHDWGFSQAGGSMNNSGGAEGIMVMASNNEVAFNTVVNCYSPNPTLGGVEGGCMEIVNGKAGAVISNVSFHHNYCERSVGMWEGCSGNFSPDGGKIQENHGIIENVTVSYNISVDAMWMYLLQPVNTDFKNVVFAHNTIIHTPKSKEWWTMPVSTDYPKGLVYTDGGHAMMGIGVDSDTVTDSAGVTTTYKTENAYYKMATGFEPGTIIVRNNIFADTVESKQNSMFILKVADHSNNIFIPSNASTGVFTVGATEQKVDLAALAFTSDYRLTSGSTPAIDKGVTIDMKAAQGLASTTISDAIFGTSFTQDVTGQSVPCGSAIDIGASEYCDGAASVSWPGPRASDDCSEGGNSSTGGASSTGGSAGTGGTSTVSTGGSSTVGTGGKATTGGSTTVGTGGKATTGGSSAVGTGGKATTGGSSTVGAGGVVTSTGGASNSNAGGAAPTDTGGAGPTDTGGASAVGNAGGQSSSPPVGGSSAVVGVGGVAAGAPGTTVSNTAPGGTAVDQGGCTCRVAGTNRNGLSAALASVGLAVMALGRRRKHSRRT